MAGKHSDSLFNSLINWRNFRLKLFAQGILVGLFAGTLVVLFRYTLEKADALLQQLYSVLRSGSPWLILVWALALLFIAYLLGTLVQKQPMISGSGIPQVKGTVMGRMQMNWFTVILAKFFGGILAIGSGLSLGREGPSIQLGAAAGQGINRLFGGLKVEERILITSGASAGLAAAFNAPLAGVIFSLEEIHKNFSPPVLMSAMAASLTADFISKHFFGVKPIFNFHTLPVLPFEFYFYLIVLGLIVGVFGAFYNWTLLKTMDIYKRQTIIPPKFIMAVPLLLSIIVGLFWPSCLGGGHGLIQVVAQGHISITILIILLIVKFVFTMLSYGTGVPGGIFLPLLVIGALTGGVFGNAVVTIFDVKPEYINNFVVFAMAGYFTAIVKAPITGSILVTEMTGSLDHLLPLIIVSMTAYIASDLLRSKPIYDELLQRILTRKGGVFPFGDIHKKTLLEIAVSLGSELDSKKIKNVDWPAHCLLVNIRRGESEIIPHGDTIILAGDYINILTSEAQAPKAYKTLHFMAEHIPKYNTKK